MGCESQSGNSQRVEPEELLTDQGMVDGPIEDEHSYVFVDGIYLKWSWDGEVQNVSVLITVGINTDDYRDILDAKGCREDKES